MNDTQTHNEGGELTRHFVSGTCKGEVCFCGRDATHKVGEEIPRDDPFHMRHNLTQYVCCQCFTNIVGNSAPCGLTRSEASEKRALDAERKIQEYEAMLADAEFIKCQQDAKYGYGFRREGNKWRALTFISGTTITDHRQLYDSLFAAYAALKERK